MKRIIKFRAWDEHTKEMFSYAKPNDFVAFSVALTDKECHIMQYTGLVDKNGKEIYEGDIISKYKNKEYETRYVVEWYQKRCGFWLRVARFDEEPRFDLNDLREDLNVIGNIYENRELQDGKR